MYEREQDRMKHDMTNTTNTSASESKQPEQAAPHAGTSADSSVPNTTDNYNGVTNTGSTTA